MFRKSILTSLVLTGMSSAAFAGMITTTDMPQVKSYLPVTVPTDTSGVMIGVEGLYWKPVNNSLSYGVTTNDSDLPVGKVLLVDPDYHLGFGLNLGYAFMGHGNDVMLKYKHLNSSDSDSITTTPNDDILTNLVHPDGFVNDVEFAKAKVRFKYDSVELLLGQVINVGNRLWLHLSTGLHYIDFDTKFNVYYDEGDGGNDDVVDITLDSKFNGIGPRAVLDGKYRIVNGLNLVAGVGGSFLLGDRKGREIQFMIPESDYDYLDVKEKRIFRTVPEVDMKLGLDYTFENTYKVCIEGGWQAVNYFGIRNETRFVDDAKVGTNIQHTSDVSFSGPYLNLNLLIG